ncbi:MAG: 23S rRNA (adenine(2503)-C(2))-methyltransferase RlmN [Anaerolineae bacterium]
MSEKLISLLDLTYAEIEAFVAAQGEPRFRARQIWDWLYRQLARDFDAMTNLPRAFRQRLSETTTLTLLEPVAETWSGDGMAQKFLFRLADGQLVESVLMHYEDEAARVADEDDPSEAEAAGRERHTVCISSQVGCAMGCVFCATGQMGLVRNLTPGEIVAQVLWAERTLRPANKRVTNVVYMGMGEPLANFENVWQSVETLHDPHGFNLGARRMTISTVGLVPGMRKLAEKTLPVNLALSIHGATDGVRDAIVPINERFKLEEVIRAAGDYVAKTGRRLTVEWVLIQNVNDTPQQAEALADLLSGLLVHVNLIPLNPTAGYDGETPTAARSLRFRDILTTRGIPTTLRMRRGIDVQAGCGQLRTKVVNARATSINPSLIQ